MSLETELNGLYAHLHHVQRAFDKAEERYNTLSVQLRETEATKSETRACLNLVDLAIEKDIQEKLHQASQALERRNHLYQEQQSGQAVPSGNEEEDQETIHTYETAKNPAVKTALELLYQAAQQRREKRIGLQEEVTALIIVRREKIKGKEEDKEVEKELVHYITSVTDEQAQKVPSLMVNLNVWLSSYFATKKLNPQTGSYSGFTKLTIPKYVARPRRELPDEFAAANVKVQILDLERIARKAEAEAAETEMPGADVGAEAEAENRRTAQKPTAARAREAKPRYYTVVRAIEELGLSRSRVYQLIEGYSIKARLVKGKGRGGKEYRILRSSVERFLEQRG